MVVAFLKLGMPTMMSARSRRSISCLMAGVSTGEGIRRTVPLIGRVAGFALVAGPIIQAGRAGMGLLARFGGLTTSGRARVAGSWALYDFANTIFSFAVVSSAIGSWLVSDARFGQRDGNFILSVAVV